MPDVQSWTSQHGELVLKFSSCSLVRSWCVGDRKWRYRRFVQAHLPERGEIDRRTESPLPQGPDLRKPFYAISVWRPAVCRLLKCLCLIRLTSATFWLPSILSNNSTFTKKRWKLDDANKLTLEVLVTHIPAFLAPFSNMKPTRTSKYANFSAHIFSGWPMQPTSACWSTGRLSVSPFRVNRALARPKAPNSWFNTSSIFAGTMWTKTFKRRSSKYDDAVGHFGFRLRWSFLIHFIFWTGKHAFGGVW